MRNVRAMFVAYLVLIAVGLGYFITLGRCTGEGVCPRNALGLAFGAAFLLTLVGQSVAGLADFNNQQVADGTDPVGYLDYVTSSSFAVDVAENWQSEYLQFFLYVFGTVWLFQRGSPESKPIHQLGRESDRDQQTGRHVTDGSPAWAKAGGWRTAVFSRSWACSWEPSFCCAGWPIRRRLGGLQQRAARPAGRSDRLGRLPGVG